MLEYLPIASLNFCEAFIKLVLIDRLGHELVHSCRDCFLHETILRVGSDAANVGPCYAKLISLVVFQKAEQSFSSRGSVHVWHAVVN